jgi:catalase
VLYDIVVLLPSEDGATQLAGEPAARDFVSDAYAHAKFIGCGAHAGTLLEATGLGDAMDEGMVAIADAGGVAPFLSRCGALRFWEREG